MTFCNDLDESQFRCTYNVLLCPSVTTVQDQRGMGGAAKQRKRGAGAERAKKREREVIPALGG